MDCIGFYVGRMRGTLVYDKSGGGQSLKTTGREIEKNPQGDRPLLSDADERYTRIR